MRKLVKTLRVNRETLIRLDQENLPRIWAGATAPMVCTSTCSLRSCGKVCP